MADVPKELFDRVNRILIVKPSALGDIVHSLPFLCAVKKRFPWARVDWVVAHGLHTFLTGHPMINRLWVIKKDLWKKPARFRRTLKEINDLRRGLAEQRYDVCIDLSGLLRSGVISAFSNAPVRLGFKESDECSPYFYTHKIHGSMKLHAIDRYLEIARFMGCAVDKIEYPFAPHNPVPDVMKELPEHYAIICPSAGKPANRWSASKYGTLASMLELPVVVIASASESDIALDVVKSSKGNAVSLAGKTSLKDLLPVIGKSQYFICNDTGPMHIAAALGVPVFAIFGPANPVRTGPYGAMHTVIQRDLECAPCYAHTPCRNYRCMEELGVAEVFDKIQDALKNPEKS